MWLRSAPAVEVGIMPCAFGATSAAPSQSLLLLTSRVVDPPSAGYINTVSPSGQLSVKTEAYPDWWLKAVGYEHGPPPVPHGNVVYV